MLDLGISRFKPIEIEQDKVLIPDFLAHCCMIASGGNGHALDWLYIVRQLDKLHVITPHQFFHDGLAGRVDQLQLLLLLDEADGILQV